MPENQSVAVTNAIADAVTDLVTQEDLDVGLKEVRNDVKALATSTDARFTEMKAYIDQCVASNMFKFVGLQVAIAGLQVALIAALIGFPSSSASTDESNFVEATSESIIVDATTDCVLP